MSLVQLLRAETRPDHDAVDARYGGFALDDPQDYARFLLAHARAVPAVEAVLRADPALPAWRERTSILAGDLGALGQAMPAAMPFAAADEAARWGALYVIEGSRLGGGMLARDVPADLPSAYLADKHRSGEWRALLTAIDARGDAADAAWHARAVAGARATFALYGAAVS